MQELRVCLYDAGDGARVASAVEDRVYDLNFCCAAWLRRARGAVDAYRLANTLVPPELGSFLAGSALVVSTARTALARALADGIDEAPGGEPLAFRLRDVRLRAPILPSSKVVGMALTFRSQAEADRMDPPKQPEYFPIMSQVVVGPDEPVILPRHHPAPVGYGTELCVVIGKRGRCIPEERVEEHIWGYTILNDVTLRDRPRGLNAHEVFETSKPTGPWIVPRDQVADIHNVSLRFRLNGETVQDGNTRDLLFPVSAMVAEVSKWLELIPGDLIATGDLGATRPLEPGDVMEAEAVGIGVLRNPVELEAEPAAQQPAAQR
ncbi:MAG: fumarylacetoacetate hydrolase family protein [Gemmatimonadetes bacterium]|nr:fumarylacetoacetate hydrolase family protein [Gemmatimonadota bacterium]